MKLVSEDAVTFQWLGSFKIQCVHKVILIIYNGLFFLSIAVTFTDVNVIFIEIIPPYFLMFYHGSRVSLGI